MERKLRLVRNSRPTDLSANGAPARSKKPSPADVQLLKAMSDLFERYGIESGDWASLAFALAVTHEPACKKAALAMNEAAGQSKKRRRTKTTIWNDARLAQLWWAVVSYRASHPDCRKMEAACYRVAQQPEWVDFNVTRDRYNESRRSPLVQMFERVRAHVGPKAFAAVMLGVDLKRVADDCQDAEILKYTNGS